MINVDLSGRTAVVTGASGGLGRTISTTLARAGADIVIHYHKNREQAEKLVREIREMGRRSMSVQAEITDQKSVFAMKEKIICEIGHPLIVVTNAVVQIHPWATVLEEEISDYESQFKSCVLQNVIMAKAFVPEMIREKWGRVIGINTECAMQNSPSQSAYVSGKRGMDGVLRVLAREVAQHGITVNQVAPGWTITDDRDDSGSEGSKNYAKGVPMKRRGVAQEIANVVAFLASDLSSFMTGVYIPVCGGNVMPAI